MRVQSNWLLYEDRNRECLAAYEPWDREGGVKERRRQREEEGLKTRGFDACYN